MVLIKSRSRPIFLEQRRALRTSQHASYFQKIMKWISYTLIGLYMYNDIDISFRIVLKYAEMCMSGGGEL